MISCFIDFDFTDLLDILLVATIIYLVYNLIKGTVAIKIFMGILLIYLIWKLVTALQMEMLGEILGQFIGVGVIALLIVFQQELRKFLLFLGNQHILTGKLSHGILAKMFREDEKDQTGINEIAVACEHMAASRTGALIVLAQQSDPELFISSGLTIDAEISSELLESIFYKNNPLHDGAVVIKDGKISLTSGVLPVSENDELDSFLGMRHRAALGLSELTDPYIIIISEQNGEISVAHEGRLERNVSIQELRKIISSRDTQTTGAS